MILMCLVNLHKRCAELSHFPVNQSKVAMMPNDEIRGANTLSNARVIKLLEGDPTVVAEDPSSCVSITKNRCQLIIHSIIDYTL